MPDQPWLPTLRRGRAISQDGTEISYEVLGTGKKTLLLANGLGGRLYAWGPLIEAAWREYRLITWDYRGLFDSGVPKSSRRLALNNHVEDAEAILDQEKVDRAVLAGWSMGVQVSLDFAATHPHRVAGLILINGTHGQVLQTGFQPVVRIPWVQGKLHAAIEFLHARPQLTQQLAFMARVTELPTTLLMAVTAGRRAPELRPILRRYFQDVLGESFPNYMRLFQELDAHSVYHLLPYIQAPALVVSGLLDALTPAYQSHEIARRLPDADHVALKRASHFALLERPEIVVPAVLGFLSGRARYEGPDLANRESLDGQATRPSRQDQV